MNSSLARVGIYILAPLLAAILTYTFMSRIFLLPLDANDQKIVMIEVTADTTFPEIAREIYSKGVIRSSWSLRLLAQFRKLNAGIQVGEYELTPSMRPAEVLEKLTSGKTFRRPIVVNEGVSVWDVGQLVDAAGLVSESDFAKALVNPGMLAAAGLDAPSFEGYLWPKSYEFSRPISANQIIRTMVDEGEKHWSPDFTARADELKLTRHEVLTMASIVQRESLKPEEQPLVASVLHNRLNKGMKLQSEATVIYGLSNYSGTLTKADREAPTPYNTFTNFGLPPGPIGNPGEGAIKASLYPQESSALFFVSNGEGGHLFLTTLEEYNDALNKLQTRVVARPQATVAVPLATPEAGAAATP